LVKAQTVDKMYFIDALSPSREIGFTDNVTGTIEQEMFYIQLFQLKKIWKYEVRHLLVDFILVKKTALIK
jgi:hypothetical protein